MQKELRNAASEFLAHKRVAVTGVSRNPKEHGSNVVYKRLHDRGYQVFAINPYADEVEGDHCYHDLKSVPGSVDWVVIGTRPESAEATVHECVELGVERVWMHRAFGSGSVSREAAEYGRRAWSHRHRRRLPVHVRTHRRSWSQAHDCAWRAPLPGTCRAPSRQSVGSSATTQPVTTRARIGEPGGGGQDAAMGVHDPGPHEATKEP